MSLTTPAQYRRRVQRTCLGGLTEQGHKQECDVHHIMRKYRATGVLNHVNTQAPQYGNFIHIPDFKEAQDMIAAAASSFQTIPAAIRAEFDNDPGKWVSFMQDPANRAAIEEYGFTTSHLPDETPAPTPTPQGQEQTPPEPPTDG